jgi:hypothetical protein
MQRRIWTILAYEGLDVKVHFLMCHFFNDPITKINGDKQPPTTSRRYIQVEPDAAATGNICLEFHTTSIKSFQSGLFRLFYRLSELLVGNSSVKRRMLSRFIAGIVLGHYICIGIR